MFLCVSDSVRNHSHGGYFELGYVYSGEARSIINGNETVISEGDYFIIEKETVHSYSACLLGALEVFNLGFTLSFVDSKLSGAETIKDAVRYLLGTENSKYKTPVITDKIFHDEDKKIFTLIEELRSEYSSQKYGFREKLRLLIKCIFIETARKEKMSESNTPVNEAISAVISEIENNPGAAQRLSEICRSKGYNYSYISREFKRATGLTFIEYVQRAKINNACRLLVTTQKSISEIAQLSGYYDYSFFNTIFKKFVGVTATQYRKKHFNA